MAFQRPYTTWWKARRCDTGPCPSCGTPIAVDDWVQPYRRLDRWVVGEVRHKRGCADELAPEVAA